jgi:hypothetical protein
LYVTAALTIIMAWRRAGSPRSNVENIANFGGQWADYCRHPLMWLGHPDPATALLDQVKHDPDGELLAALMTEWEKAFGSASTTVRKAAESAENGNSDLLDAMCEFPIQEKGGINHSKLGWQLKKNANRVIDGREFQKSEADGRVAWRVAAVKTPPLPPSPPLNGPPAKTVTKQAEVVEVVEGVL